MPLMLVAMSQGNHSVVGRSSYRTTQIAIIAVQMLVGTRQLSTGSTAAPSSRQTWPRHQGAVWTFEGMLANTTD
eukprot:4089314-Amphidinium_carterae.1